MTTLMHERYRGNRTRATARRSPAGDGHGGGEPQATPEGQDGRAPGRQFGQSYIPPGWPSAVLPPGVVDWEKSAACWLFDCCPADYRAYPVLRRHPVILACFVADFVEGQIRSSRAALAKARAALTDYVEPQVLESAITLLETEETRLVRVRRSVALVEEALRGKVFLPRS